MKTRVIGVDCATQDAKVGLALGVVEHGQLEVECARRCAKGETAVKVVAGWLRAPAGRTLLALDAPLGWPAPLARQLLHHRAGAGIATPPNDLFRRETDRSVRRRIGKTPLDVGADRIARTAHAALRLLGDLRSSLELSIPLAWNADFSPPCAAIEVYPAATLVSHGFPAAGYKGAGDEAVRLAIIEGLRTLATLPSDVAGMKNSADALDAVVCLLAATDFLVGRAVPPVDRELAEQEGWIWVRDPGP